MTHEYNRSIRGNSSYIKMKANENEKRRREKKPTSQPAYTLQNPVKITDRHLFRIAGTVSIYLDVATIVRKNIGNIFTFWRSPSKNNIYNRECVRNFERINTHIDSWFIVLFCSFRFVSFHFIFFLQRIRKEYFVSLIRLNKSVVKGKPIPFHIISAISQPFDAH